MEGKAHTKGDRKSLTFYKHCEFVPLLKVPEPGPTFVIMKNHPSPMHVILLGTFNGLVSCLEGNGCKYYPKSVYAECHVTRTGYHS